MTIPSPTTQRARHDARGQERERAQWVRGVYANSFIMDEGVLVKKKTSSPRG